MPTSTLTVSCGGYGEAYSPSLPARRRVNSTSPYLLVRRACAGSCGPPWGDRTEELGPRHRDRIGYGVLVFELVAVVQGVQHPRQLPSLQMAGLGAPAVEIPQSGHQFDG